MPWSDICTEEALERAERVVAAMIGTLSNTYNETFADELNVIVAELDWDGDEMIRLLSCVALIAAGVISRLAEDNLTPLEEDKDETPEESTRRSLEMQGLLTACVAQLRDLDQGSITG